MLPKVVPVFIIYDAEASFILKTERDWEENLKYRYW